MRSAFGQTRSAIGQMRARLAKMGAQLAKRTRNLPNVAHLVKCRAFDQLVKCAAHLAKCADWSNAPYSTIMFRIVRMRTYVLLSDNSILAPSNLRHLWHKLLHCKSTSPLSTYIRTL